MIDNYSFIDANSSGNKEAFISGNKVGFNKLSANETNLIKDKLNEIIGQVNLNQIPLYPNFSLKFKGENNIMLNQLQAGDIVHGFYDENTIWTNARYNGGDINDKANYTNLDEGVVTRIEKFSDLYSGSSTFTLPTFAQIIEVSVNGWSTENYTTPNDTTVIINEAINTGQQVVILYLVDENLNIAPYYTQAQVDALIAGVGGGVTTHDIISTDIFIDPDEYVDTASVAFIQGFWYNIGDYVFVEVSFEVLFFPSNAEDSGSFLLTFLNGLNVVTFIGKIVKGDSLYTLTETFYTAKVEGFSANKVKIKYNGSTSAETSHIVSVRFNFKTT